jgi:hypothetical protein
LRIWRASNEANDFIAYALIHIIDNRRWVVKEKRQARTFREINLNGKIMQLFSFFDYPTAIFFPKLPILHKTSKRLFLATG